MNVYRKSNWNLDIVETGVGGVPMKVNGQCNWHQGFVQTGGGGVGFFGSARGILGFLSSCLVRIAWPITYKKFQLQPYLA